MTDSVASLRRKITSTEELKSVVSTMKAMASSSISQYEHAVYSLDDYYRTVQLGLIACFQRHNSPNVIKISNQQDRLGVGVIVFGSDQGLVGQFNEVMAEFVTSTLATLSGHKIVWAVGERIKSRLADTHWAEKKVTLKDDFILPNSINAITALVGDILTDIEAQRELGTIDQVYLFHHRPQVDSIYKPVSQQLLPLSESLQKNFTDIKWPTNNLPEVLPERDKTLRALVREYLFVSLFRACAESLASENASRLAAMQRAEKNIDEQQNDLNLSFHRLRQSDIDEELFDVVSGFEALSDSD
ncbi:F0F1 ATP synthase subunit gamma [Colwellia sp. MB02u-10]|uniref:F0F1 ATP synthase subunit gamma n=1 Tax=Colwellia sp. MB02u-10 TaxID=2759828 RepID=UPI0015F352B5|nr:F0F1 ATP synthase subunit gamma [Colwellia sp. MB02u-10]MBA6342563.1 F0F1 ATP synthase subunit gamma [Colwellia sp. MB02u-10]